MQVIIGVDPHKATHTAVAIDRTEGELGRARVRAPPQPGPPAVVVGRAVASGRGRSSPRAGSGYLLAQQLVAAGETVVDVPATLASRIRVLGTGRSDKNDPNDALSVAVAALRAPALRRGRRRRSRRGAALVGEAQHRHRQPPDPGGVPTPHAADGARTGRNRQGTQRFRRRSSSSTRSNRPTPVEADPPRPGRRAARRHPPRSTPSSRRRTNGSAPRSPRREPPSPTLFGVGPIIACYLIGYTGDITRFANRDHYAAYNGTAPVERSSGGRVVHRLSQRGNRRLNHALHMAAICQIRQPHSEGRAYFDRKSPRARPRKKRSGPSSDTSATPSTASSSSTPTARR